MKILLKSLAFYLVILVVSINLMKIASENLSKQNTKKMIGIGRMSILKIKQLDNYRGELTMRNPIWAGNTVPNNKSKRV